MKREQRLVDLKIEQSGKPTSEKMTSHGSVSDLPADIVSIDRVLIRLSTCHLEIGSCCKFSSDHREKNQCWSNQFIILCKKDTRKKKKKCMQ